MVTSLDDLSGPTFLQTVSATTRVGRVQSGLNREGPLTPVSDTANIHCGT